MYNLHIYERTVKELNEFGNEWELVVNGDNCSIELKSDRLIGCWYSEYEKKYLFSLNYRALTYIDHYAYNDSARNYTEPNKVGKLSERKIREWIEYYQNIERDLLIKSAQRVERADAFKKRIFELRDKYGDKIVSIYQPKDETWRKTFKGSISLGAFEFTFSVDDTSGYIEERLEKTYKTGHDLDAFLELGEMTKNYTVRK